MSGRFQKGLFAMAIKIVAFSLMTRNTARAFSTLSPILHSLSIKRNFRSTKRLQSAVSNEEITKEKAVHDTSPMRRYVVIQKNKQSMAFRNGSPLVYSGSIERTIQIHDDGASKESVIPMGSLVAVIVSGENNRGASNSKGRNQRRGKGNTQKTKIDYKHYIVNKSDASVCEYDIGGELINEFDNSSDVEKGLSQGKLIGFGLFNPRSMYRTFIFCHQTNYPNLFKQVNTIFKSSSFGEQEKTEAVIKLVMTAKINDAMRSRMHMNLPSKDTDSYRLINGEGDGLAGFAVDIIGGKVAVAMASASWVEIYKDTIISVLGNVLKSHPAYEGQNELDIIWRNTPMRLKQDGFTVDEVPNEEYSRDTAVTVMENKIKYYTYPYGQGQKTGFYCDQRENRFNLALQCEDKRVLDLCCYNGGFSLNAVVHGKANSCVGIDSSQDAIDAAIANAELNGVGSRVEFHKADIAKYMNNAEEEGKEFDVIILDPPKLAPTINALDRASRKYHSLNRDACKLINSKEGGLLLTCTCSGAMTQRNGGQYFLQTIRGAALAAGRRITLLRSSGAAPCHVQDPSSYPANAYLTAALFYVSPKEDVN